MFPPGCKTVVKRRKTDSKICVCGVPAPKDPKDATESKQENSVDGYEFDIKADGTSYWVPAGHYLCVPTEHGLPVAMDAATFETEFEDP